MTTFKAISSSRSSSPFRLAALFRDLAVWPTLSALDHDALLRQADRAGLTASLGRRLATLDINQPNPKIRDRLHAAEVVAHEHARRLRFGVQLVAQAFAHSDIPVVILKGGAYLLDGLPNAAGRLVSDLDLLVSESHLAAAEQLLQQAGWESDDGDEYDDQYYREWMHELPPLQHPHHGITVDVHHNLSPRTGRLEIDAEGLLQRAQPLRDDPRFLRLAHEDLVLHLCIHLFHDGEFQNGLRELLDLDGVLRHCATSEGFWSRLLTRASDLGLQRPLYYGCHFSAQRLGTPVPADVQQDLLHAVPCSPGQRIAQAAMGQCLSPLLGDAPSWHRRLAQSLLLLRGHWLRMPPGLLLRHLFTQMRRRGGLKTKEAAARQAG